MRTARGSTCAWALLCLLSCGKPSEPAPASAQPLKERPLRAALTTYAQIAFATYDDSVLGADLLAQRSRELAARPSAESLRAAREAWLRARIPYAQSEVFRFYDGPIDKLELWVNTWPIDESYVEAAPGEDSPGIVQDSKQYPALSAELLTRLNGQAGETAISTGYHVIEFLLWGRDQSEAGPGERSHLDFVAGPKKANAELAARRASYLTLASELLVAQLREVREAWRPGVSDNYRARFLALPPKQALYLALKGMAKLSGPELAGERLTVAYETKNQENEHSCFSDSTQQDLANNALGIENVCLGRYRRTDGSRQAGPALCGVLKAAVPVFGARLANELRQSTRDTAQIPAPFDRAIQGGDEQPGRVAIARAIRSLRAQAATLDQIQVALELSEPGAQAVR
jgi:putative iron-regulated protein